MARPAKTNTTINGREYYRITRIIDGSRKQFYGKTKGEAERKYREYIERKDTQEPTKSPHTQTFGELAEDYVREVLKPSQKYAKGTIDRYDSVYRIHVKGTPLSRMKIDKIEPMDIQRFYNGLDVSMQTMKTIHKFMTAFYKWLVRMRYSENVLLAVEIPKKKENKQHDGIVIWTDEEIHTILSALDSAQKASQRFRLVFMVKVLLYTGVRISEALSLRNSDIRDGVLHVDRQYYRGEIKEPKWGSKRQIPMHDELIKAYDQHREWQKKDMEYHGYDTNYLFTTNKGKLYSDSSIRKSLVRFCENIGIEYKHIHAYRATFCTQMCKCGVPLEVTSKLMGHKNLDVTAAHYALVSPETQSDAIKMLHFF